MKKDLNNFEKFNFLINLEEKASKTPDKMTPRERLATLFDNGEYKEMFRFARPHLMAESFKDGLVSGFGMINGRPAIAYASEYSYQGGSVGVSQAKQITELFKFARQSGIPIIALSESGGARLTDSIHIMEGMSAPFKEAVFNSGVIPQITCILGHCIGASAFMALYSDFIMMLEDSTLCISGASVNKVATGEDVTEKDMGGVDIHNKYSGAVHFVHKEEKEAILKVRQLLQYLPQNNAEKPPFFECHDSETREEPSILDIIPDNSLLPFDMKKLITLFTDDNDFLEVQPDFASNLLTGFARFGGYTVGIVANQPTVMAGALDSNAFRKMARFINFLGAYNIPLISFIDVPGAVPTVEEHKNGILTHGAQTVFSLGHHKALKISIIVRKCFGGAYCMITPKLSAGDIIYAYPSAEIGIMSDKAATTILGKDPKMKEKIDLVHSKGLRLDEPLFTADNIYIDDIIHPAKTRVEIIQALKAFSNKRFLDIPPKWIYNQPL